MKTKASPYVFIVPPSLSFPKEEESGGTRWRRKGVDVHHDVYMGQAWVPTEQAMPMVRREINIQHYTSI
jgi:hypothetical protein